MGSKAAQNRPIYVQRFHFFHVSSSLSSRFNTEEFPTRGGRNDRNIIKDFFVIDCKDHYEFRKLPLVLPAGSVEEKIHVSRLKRKRRRKKNNKKVGETILVFGLKVLLWLLDTSSRLDLIGDKDFVQIDLTIECVTMTFRFRWIEKIRGMVLMCTTVANVILKRETRIFQFE